MLLHMYQVFITLLGHLHVFKFFTATRTATATATVTARALFWRSNLKTSGGAIIWKIETQLTEKKGINKQWFTMTNKKKQHRRRQENRHLLFPPPLPLFPPLFSTQISWFSALISQQVFLFYFSHFFAFYGNYFKWVNIVKACFEKQLTREKAQEEKLSLLH